MTPRSRNADHILNPKLPYDMAPRADRAASDEQLLQFVASTADVKNTRRTAALRSAFGENRDALRTLAGKIKRHTLDHLDAYLETFIDRAEAAGAKVHFAKDAPQVGAICLAIAKANGSKLCVKSKSMVTEETHLADALQAAGIETIETDLGEFIVQLRNEPPYHFVFPAMHLKREEIGTCRQLSMAAR